MKIRLTPLAASDVADALRTTFDQFGPGQLRVYSDLIDEALRALAEEPGRPGSRSRSNLGRSIRSFHLKHLLRRRRGARHEIYYRIQRGSHGEEELVAMRVLHDAMEPAARVEAAIRDDLKRS